jgi:hypothetical protein
VLSLFFARRALGVAVDAVRDAGHRAVDAMDRARRATRGEPYAGAARETPESEEGSEDTGRLRVEHGDEPRVRVEDERAPSEGDEVDEEDREESAGRIGRSRG